MRSVLGSIRLMFWYTDGGTKERGKHVEKTEGKTANTSTYMQIEQTRLTRNLFYGFWCLPSSLVANFLLREVVALVYLLVFNHYFVFFVFIHLVFCLKTSSGRFNHVLNSFLLISFKTCLNLVCLFSNKLGNFPTKNCRCIRKTYYKGRHLISVCHFLDRHYIELNWFFM